jgi:hypothetical protein
MHLIRAILAASGHHALDMQVFCVCVFLRASTAQGEQPTDGK